MARRDDIRRYIKRYKESARCRRIAIRGHIDRSGSIDSAASGSRLDRLGGGPTRRPRWWLDRNDDDDDDVVVVRTPT